MISNCRLFYLLNVWLIAVITSCSGKDLRKQIQQNNAKTDFAIYEYILKDSNNFILYTEEDRFSEIKFVRRKSKRWDKKRFFIPAKDKLLAFMRGDYELSPYTTTYLFEKHEDFVTSTEKIALADFAEKTHSETIQYTFKNLVPIAKNDRFKGFCVELTRPVYASDTRTVFLDLYLHRNYTEAVLDSTSYYEKIGFILKKDTHGKWRIIERKTWIML